MKKTIICTVAVMLITTFVSCSKDDDDALHITSSKEVVILSNETSQITCSDKNATYNSEDEYVAKVSESGLIEAQHIGETYIDVNGKKTVKVTVNPIYTSFIEPIFLFGATKDDVISKVGSDYTSATSSSIIYVPKIGNVKAYIYLLDDGKVSAVGMTVSTIYTKSITNFLLERYMPATVIDDDDFAVLYINALDLDKTTMVIGEQLYSTSYLNIIYFPFDKDKYTSRSINNYNELIIKINELFKQLNLK